MFTFLIGCMSFFLMPACPTRTTSWWNPKGYFNEREQKIIVNSGERFQHVKPYESIC
jgi:hypothetical protein